MPHLLAVMLETHPIGRIALEDGRHRPVLAYVLDDQRLAQNQIFARKMNCLVTIDRRAMPTCAPARPAPVRVGSVGQPRPVAEQTVLDNVGGALQ